MFHNLLLKIFDIVKHKMFESDSCDFVHIFVNYLACAGMRGTTRVVSSFYLSLF